MVSINSLRLPTAILFSLFLFHIAFAQARIGSVQGTVKDPSGALLPGAKITITQPLTRYTQTVQSDQQGQFKLVNIPFNTYKIVAEAPGFQSTEQSIDLETTIPTNLELSL
ncbi:MAG TPA: carboxypeptidase-like regulatory domain-containing protein, partial [Pyrinomonadaceae bacterium]